MTRNKQSHHFLGAVFLIAGTSIGVGMLALPVSTAEAGFLGSLPVYFFVWLLMLSLSRLILEGCLWCPKEANLITITRTLLGEKGAICCWILYLFLFYCLMIAHTVAGGQVVESFKGSGPSWVSMLIYVLTFAPAVYLGTQWVDRLNLVLMAGVICTFSLFFFEALSFVRLDFLQRTDFSSALKPLPVLFTAFGFQNLIPTLVSYMHRDEKKIKLAIWIGTSIPLGLYILWQLLIHGIVPYETLKSALALGESAVSPLQEVLQNSNISKIGVAFAFFAMTTSFVGIALAFFDFWADGLKWKKSGWRRVALLVLVFGIPYAISCINPSIFFTALTWAGGIGVALLLGILPILFVWSGRYIQKRSSGHRELPGGKATLAALFLICTFVIYQMV